jgi:predicted Rossmann fold nucleotide-binding protein DprA/Smf involved in DNA uptake
MRSGLLAELSAVIDLRARDRSRLVELLARDDRELIGLLGGRRREALARAHRQGRLTDRCARASAICVHSRRFPRRLRARGAPRLLYTEGDGALLGEGDRLPAVAILGASRPSEYGLEIARSLSYSLVSSGVLVVTLNAQGIARAARIGAERAGRGAVVLNAGGLDAAGAIHGAAADGRTRGRSCLVSELPPGCPGRRWGVLAAERTAVALSDVLLVVEAKSARLFAVELARAGNVQIAAVPGRATSPLAQGPLELLADGGALVCCAGDVLKLLGRAEGPPAPSVRDDGLPAGLGRVLERVGSGQETPEQLLDGGDRAHTLLALAQLELMGRVRRTGDGRYFVTVSVP